jgi:hypothetical protein
VLLQLVHCCRQEANLYIGDDDQDWFCKQRPSARRGFQFFMFEDSTMVLGGYDGFNTYRDDLWIRGKWCCRASIACHILWFAC